MELGNPVVAPLYGAEIHGFNTTADLDIQRIMNDASKRWLRPNEVHAILSNYTLFRVEPQPVDAPSNGTLLLFDRKMLRNFRKDGHKWRKKKDGKTVQEAHEKLKIGNEERIHVYYARNEDDPNFYRRCYWLLNRNLERIVLVHYRQTSDEGTTQSLLVPIESKEASPVISSNASNHSDLSSSAIEEINSGVHVTYAGCHTSQDFKLTECEDRELSVDGLDDNLSWNDLMMPSFDLSSHKNGNIASREQLVVYSRVGHDILLEELSVAHPNCVPSNEDLIHGEQPSKNHLPVTDFQKFDPQFSIRDTVDLVNGQMPSSSGNMSKHVLKNDALHTQSSFGQWAYLVEEMQSSLEGPQNKPQLQNSENQVQNDPQATICSSYQEYFFTIVDISPGYAYHMEETKLIVVGYFHESHKHLQNSNIFCVFGDTCVPAYPLKVGVYRTTVMPNSPGSVDFFLTLDGHTPISQVMDFECRCIADTLLKSGESSAIIDKETHKKSDYDILLRLVRLLFTTTNSISVLSNNLSPNYIKNAKKFASTTTPFLENRWKKFLNLDKDDDSIHHHLLELIIKNKLQEWLLLRIAEGCRAPSHDSQGQGIIHLCAMLDYTWAIRLYSLSGLSLDFRDIHGWTPLHWAAYYGREKIVATLLSAGANPSLVTDPNHNFPGGCTPADLASQEGYEGLGAYLAEQALTAHFQAMALSGNAASPPPSSFDYMKSENTNSKNLSEQELCLKDSLAAYRNAADAADRIQAAFRERALKQQIKAAQLKPEEEASSIVAALKIQKAFRNHNRRKLMKAAVRIQGTFRTWQARKKFCNIRRQTIKIQAAFRGHMERKQYKKICWSVGILEKAIIRWKRKRKGLRGIQAESITHAQEMEEENSVEEEFFRVGREQAQDRVQRSVVRVQAMFRSYRAQQEYRSMKLAYTKAKVENDNFDGPINEF